MKCLQCICWHLCQHDTTSKALHLVQKALCNLGPRQQLGEPFKAYHDRKLAANESKQVKQRSPQWSSNHLPLDCTIYMMFRPALPPASVPLLSARHLLSSVANEWIHWHTAGARCETAKTYWKAFCFTPAIIAHSPTQPAHPFFLRMKDNEN